MWRKELLKLSHYLDSVRPLKVIPAVSRMLIAMPSFGIPMIRELFI